jgi:hypothetical protein
VWQAEQKGKNTFGVSTPTTERQKDRQKGLCLSLSRASESIAFAAAAAAAEWAGGVKDGRGPRAGRRNA